MKFYVDQTFLSVENMGSIAWSINGEERKRCRLEAGWASATQYSSSESIPLRRGLCSSQTNEGRPFKGHGDGGGARFQIETLQHLRAVSFAQPTITVTVDGAQCLVLDQHQPERYPVLTVGKMRLVSHGSHPHDFRSNLKECFVCLFVCLFIGFFETGFLGIALAVRGLGGE